MAFLFLVPLPFCEFSSNYHFFGNFISWFNSFLFLYFNSFFSDEEEMPDKILWFVQKQGCNFISDEAIMIMNNSAKIVSKNTKFKCNKKNNYKKTFLGNNLHIQCPTLYSREFNLNLIIFTLKIEPIKIFFNLLRYQVAFWRGRTLNINPDLSASNQSPVKLLLQKREI